MKVLAIANRSYKGYTPTGGAETMLASIMEYLAAAGHEASAVLVGRPRDLRVINGVSVHRRKTDTDMADLVTNADLLITHLGATATGKMLGKKYDKPVAQLVHNTNEFTAGFLGSGCDYAIYNADWVKEAHDELCQSVMIRVLDRTEKASAVMLRRTDSWPSMVFHPPAERPYIGGAELGRAVTLINLVPNKGPDVFYALAEMNPDIQFMGVIGGYEREHHVIRDLPNVTIHEHVSDVSEIYLKTSVLLVPSIYESYGRVAVEAMQYGIPVIASGTPGLVECLSDAGPICDREDITKWDKALHDVLDNYEGWRADAQHRYEELYEQTQREFPELVIALEGVAHGDHLNR